MTNAQLAKSIIKKIIYITIASVDRNGNPWNTPVYFAYDDKFNFYWASWKDNQHSQNIRNNKNIFIVIYDSTVPEGTGQGVYIKAKAYELNDPTEINHAATYCYARKGKTPRKAEEFLGSKPRRMYKAVPEQIWINDSGNIKGDYIDTRVEVDLKDLIDNQEESNFPNIGNPAKNALVYLGFTNMDQLTELTEKELLNMHGVGPKAVRILKEALKLKGKSFKT